MILSEGNTAFDFSTNPFIHTPKYSHNRKIGRKEWGKFVKWSEMWNPLSENSVPNLWHKYTLISK